MSRPARVHIHHHSSIPRHLVPSRQQPRLPHRCHGRWLTMKLGDSLLLELYRKNL